MAVEYFNPIILPERAQAILGVPGRYTGATQSAKSRPGCFAMQTWESEQRPFPAYGPKSYIVVGIRHDDKCGNGHNSFAITAHIATPGRRDWGACGCLHDEIAQAFPELAGLIKWHLCATDGPMHYIANATYHASNRDHNGLLLGETRQIRNGKSNLPAWQLAAVAPDGEEIPTYKLPKNVDAAERPYCGLKLEWRPWNLVGEGKPRDLGAARSCAVWPDAPDDVLMLPKPELTTILTARLPALLAEFRAAVDGIGFLFEREG